MALDLVGGSLFTLLYDGVKKAMVKTTRFKSLLADLKSTLDSLQPRILQQIGEHNTELGLQNQEIEDLQRQMEEGVKLVQKFSKFRVWNYCCVGDYTDQLHELDRALRRLLEMLRLQEVRDVKETLLLSRQNHDKLDEVSRKLTEIQRLLLQQRKPGDVMEATGSGNDTETVPEPIQGNGIQAALDGGDDLEAIFGMLFYAILEAEVKAVMFKAPLGDLKSTLYSLKPLIEEIAKCNKVLVRPKEELEKLAKQIKMGVELIPKCSKVHSWASCKKSTYTERLHGLDKFLQKQLSVLKMQVAKDVKNTLVFIRNIEVVIEHIEKSGVLRDQIQTEYLSDVAEPLAPTRRLEIVNVQSIKDFEETVMSIKNTESSVKPMEESSAAQKPLKTKGTKNASKDYTFLPRRFSIFSKNIVSDTSSSAETSLFPEATKSRYQSSAGTSVFSEATTSTRYQSSAGTSVFSEATTSTYDSIDDQSTDGHILETPNVRLFTSEELQKATRNFKAELLLGEGKFGRVFKGWMDGNAGTGMPVAIKRLRPEYFLGFKEWQSEVNNMARLSHPNLVKLLGCCYDGKERLVVYEYMRGGNYDNHLFRRNSNKEPVSWDNRIKIAVGAARGLAFLHSLERQIIYGEFRTSKILLDENYNAKLSDPDLLVSDPDLLVSTRYVRVLGYCPPEFIEIGHFIAKSDVYSFGVVLLESLTGLRALDRNRPQAQQMLVDMAKPLLSNKKNLKRIMDVRMEGQYSFKAALKTAHVILKCLARDPKSRPSMNEVVEALIHIQATK